MLPPPSQELELRGPSPLEAAQWEIQASPHHPCTQSSLLCTQSSLPLHKATTTTPATNTTLHLPPHCHNHHSLHYTPSTFASVRTSLVRLALAPSSCLAESIRQSSRFSLVPHCLRRPGLIVSSYPALLHRLLLLAMGSELESCSAPPESAI